MLSRIFVSLTLLITLFGCASHAQNLTNNGKTISINMTSNELVEADLIVFNININAEGNSPQEAYRIHKQREEVLAGLLSKFDIEEKEIQFQPIRINKMYRDKNKTSQTSQSVTVTFSDFNIYETIQVTLIENGFDSFNGKFTSSMLEEGKERALTKAIDAAKEKAQTIADASGVKLGTITQINYSDYQIGTPRFADMETKMMSGAPDMMDFSQMVSVSANISIVYSID